MGSDQRTYIKVHDGMADHPKIDSLSDRAFRLLVETWCWCSRHLTDGKVKEASWIKRGTPSTRQELLAAGLAEVIPGGIQMHDYLEHQRSADEVAALREKRRSAGVKGGKARARALASARGSAKQSASKSVPESESTYVLQTETELSTSTPSAAAEGGLFVAFWLAYPRKAGKQDAEKAFNQQRKTTAPSVIIAGAKRLAADPNLPSAQFIPHPATWLRAGQWTDDPLPERQDKRAPSDHRAAHNLALIEHYEQQERKALS